jgi:ribosome-associated protein
MATKRKAAGKKGFAGKGAAKRGGGSKPAGKKPVKRFVTRAEAKPTGRAGARGGKRAAPPRKAVPPKGAPVAPPAAPQPDTGRPLALAIAKAGLAKKAEDVLLLDVRGLTSYADYFVVMTAESDRQAGAIADHVDDELRKAGATKVGVEGYEAGRWILVDYGDVVAHVMSRDAREFYDLEGLWADAPRTQISD